MSRVVSVGEWCDLVTIAVLLLAIVLGWIQQTDGQTDAYEAFCRTIDRGPSMRDFPVGIARCSFRFLKMIAEALCRLPRQAST